MDSAVEIDLAAGFLPLSQLVPLKLVSQRFKGKFRDRSLALDVRPQRTGPFSPAGRRGSD